MHSMNASPTRRAVLAGGAGALGLLLAGCTQSKDAPAPSTGSQRRVLILQTPAASGSWDPVVATDLESQRISRQIYDTLIAIEAETGNPAAGLSTSWTVSDDGLVYEFTLREGVSFQDGTAFDANAVVANFKRWNALGSVTDPAVASVSTLFDAAPDANALTPRPAVEPPEGETGATPSAEPTADPDAAPLPQTTTADPLEDPLALTGSPFKRVEATDAKTVRLQLERPLTPLIRALTNPCFGIVSPAALKEAGALNGMSQGDKLGRSNAGTGAFSAALDGATIVLTAVPEHFAGDSQVDEVRLTPVTNVTRRVWDLEAGRTQGFDLVTVDVLKDLVQNTQQVLQRDPFSVAYLGLNRSNKWLAKEQVRRAMAHAIDRGALIDGLFITSTRQASSVLPPSLGIADPTTAYAHDPEKAKRLLAAAGYAGEAIPFHFPTDVARPYLPLPERLYSRLATQLSAVGLVLAPQPRPWDEGYFQDVLSGDDAGLHLLGAQGTFRDPENFLGRLFARVMPEFNYDSPEVRRRIRVAKSLPDGEARNAAYADVVELLTIDLPLIPLAYPISALAMGPNVAQYPVSPFLDEPLRSVVLSA